eukprot:GHRR01026235.1.p2 GENE.GHRR01026235.1~~GHRR01026235.1.p2  ORF type:complete len:138 (+),score=34.31 GHRR01026235.1:772-1185(+)
MPLNSLPCTTTAERLKEKMAIAEAKAKVNIGFWGGITPDNAAKHDILWGMLKAGALGFKSFVAPSGINDFANVSRADVANAVHFLLSKGAPYFMHAELLSEVKQEEVRTICRQSMLLLLPAPKQVARACACAVTKVQ